MIDLLLVNPPTRDAYGPLGDLAAIEPPLWCRLLAAHARDKGWDVRILDAEALELSAEEAATQGANLDPRICAIVVYGHQPSASTQSMPGAGAFAKAFRRISSAEIIMLGGHPSALPERTLHEETIDYVGVGEGPATLDGLLACRPPGIIPGLAWIPGRTKRAHINPSAPLTANLRELHGHAWDLLPMERYRAHNWHCFGDLEKRQPYASIYTTLGCPYKCTFCCINAPFQSNRYRMRNPEDVVDEIEYLVEDYGIETIKITDEMFVLNERHYGEICQGLIDRGLGQRLNIWAYARVDTVKPALLKLLQGAGVRWLALGIESGSAHVREGADKALKTNDIVGTVRAIQYAGIHVIGNFMFGLRDDTKATMKQTLELAIACMPDFANFYCTMAYPGSGLWGEAVGKGWTLPSTWSGFSQHGESTRPLDTEHINGLEVLKYRDAAFGVFFQHPRYLDHVAKKFGAETKQHIEAMAQRRLKRAALPADTKRPAGPAHHRPTQGDIRSGAQG